MNIESDQGDVSFLPLRDQINHNKQSDTTGSSSSIADDDIEESQCLFCDQSSTDLEQNLEHMSKIHGLHVVTTNLLVDIGSLLNYFHLVISCYHECLFCGTQRNSRQAAQQHMIAKGHCKYDLTAKDAEFRDFYDLSSLESDEDSRRSSFATRLSNSAQAAAYDKAKKPRFPKRSNKHSLDVGVSPAEQASTSSSPAPEAQSDDYTSSDDNTGVSGPLEALSIRAHKRSHIVDTQLSQLRANDRRSLLHLPVSQQRALLETHHKQMEKARRSEQTQRGNLESAGNSFARLGTIRLIRKPPHTGRVQTLKR